MGSNKGKEEGLGPQLWMKDKSFVKVLGEICYKINSTDSGEVPCEGGQQVANVGK